MLKTYYSAIIPPTNTNFYNGTSLQLPGLGGISAGSYGLPCYGQVSVTAVSSDTTVRSGFLSFQVSATGLNPPDTKLYTLQPNQALSGNGVTFTVSNNDTAQGAFIQINATAGGGMTGNVYVNIEITEVKDSA
jgi:hypothetical protein